MTCEACNISKQNLISGLYIVGCKECSVRHLSRSLSYWKAKQRGKIGGDYEKALIWLFGDDWKEGHKMVKNVESTYRQSPESQTK